jgi:serine/threonine-protein kinase
MVEDAQQGPLGLGEKFLKYSILEIVGRGDHAWVYAAHDEFFDREVAIKILHRPGGVAEEMLRRGRVEAQLLGRLRHPNVVEVVDAGVTNDGQLYIVMELLRGSTLREILRARGKLGVAEALGLFIAVAGGVQAAHDLGAIHRDLKPENLFVLENGTPKVLDFGIAKIVGSAGWATDKDFVYGDVLYTSPEQLEGARATARSDVYALGVMLYEVLVGKHPCLLANPPPQPGEFARIQRLKQPPLLNEIDDSVPHHVARAVARATAKAPEARVASMIELREALTTCLERLRREGESTREPSTRAATNGAWEPATGSERGQTAPPVTTHANSDWDRASSVPFRGRRRTLRRVVAGAAIVGLLLGGGLFLAKQPASNPATAAGDRASAATARELAPPRGTLGATASPPLLPVSASSSELRGAVPPAANDAGLRPDSRAPAKRPGGKKHKHVPLSPEREVWIE